MNYKDIKDFSERCETHPDHQQGMITSTMIIQRLDQEVQELRAYIEEKEKNTSQLDRLEKLLVNVRTEEFDNWCKESDDGADEEKNT